MDRRTLLRRGVAAGGVLLAGCMGSKPEEENTLNEAAIDFYADEDGYLTVSVVVTNAGNEPETGTLLVHAEINGDAQPRVREISLDAHETKEYTFTYDVKLADVTDFSVSATIQN